MFVICGEAVWDLSGMEATRRPASVDPLVALRSE
jgi:hypothetical protein